jgi:hypothetical protein
MYIYDIIYIMRNTPMSETGKVGRPKRVEDVTSILLRIPPALLKRVERCKARLEFQEGTSIPRTTVFWRLLEAGCDTLEGREAQTVVPGHTPISTISEISNNMPGYGSVQDEERPALMPQAQDPGMTAPGVRDQVAETAPQPEPVAGEATAKDDNRPSAIPPFDASKYALGELCVHGHDYHGTGQALRRLSDNECLECHRARASAYRQRKRQAQPA